MKIIPQLAFDGSGDAAIALYKEAFGLTVKTLMHYRDAVSFGWEKPNEALNDRVYHSELVLGGTELRVTDMDTPENTALTQQITLNVGLDTEADVRRAFAILADGGTVIRELTCPPYMVIIGDVRDRFGVHWCLMCDF